MLVRCQGAALARNRAHRNKHGQAPRTSRTPLLVTVSAAKARCTASPSQPRRDACISEDRSARLGLAFWRRSGRGVGESPSYPYGAKPARPRVRNATSACL